MRQPKVNPLTFWTNKMLKEKRDEYQQRVKDEGTELPITLWHIKLEQIEQEISSRVIAGSLRQVKNLIAK